MNTALDFVLRTPIEPTAGRSAAWTVPADGTPALQFAVDARFAMASASACGPNHPANEDAVSALVAGGSLFVVADGVGGGAMARLASRTLVRSLHGALASDASPPTPEDVRRAVLEADRTIADSIARVTADPGAATVVLAAPLDAAAARWLVAWVGDCRAYRLARGTTPGTGGARAARIDLLTRDDTFRHLGERVPPGSLPDDPARMIGNGATLGANVAVHDLGPGEVLALCSDGVHRRLGAGDWRRVLAQRVSLAERCEDAIRVARAHGSEDDATVLLIERPASRPAGAGGPEPGALRRVGRALQAAFVRRRGDGGAS